MVAAAFRSTTDRLRSGAAGLLLVLAGATFAQQTANAQSSVLAFERDPVGNFGDFVALPFVSKPNDLTIAAWIKLSDRTNGAPSTSGSIMAWSQASTPFSEFRVYDGHLGWIERPWNPPFGVIESTATLAPCVWTHVAVTRTLSAGTWTIKLFINGVLETTGSTTVSAVDQNTLTIGGNRRFGVVGLPFDGSMRGVSFWNTALSDAAIPGLMTEIANSHPNYANLVSYWLMNEGTGQLVADSKGANHGTLGANSGVGSDDPAWVGESFTLCTVQPPIANAGADFSVDEGQASVALNGSASSDPDNDPLTYAWEQVGVATVTLTGADTVAPSFDAPLVTANTTLTFKLTVTANGESATDTVDVTVVNVNHVPVADAGTDQSVAEGTLGVVLNGSDSYDDDMDTLTYTWLQIGGPAVSLSSATDANPTFDAPYFGGGGAPGVVATLDFQLTVDDGFGGSATDTVSVDITNVNNVPIASAGPDQTVDEDTPVSLSGAVSSDPDGDALSYYWLQTGGTGVVLTGADTATPSFTAPFVNPGGGDLAFQLTVSDGYGGQATDQVVVHVQNANDPPLVTAAAPTVGTLWPPTHGLVSVGITGVSDPDNNATIVITGVTQDEPTNGLGDGDTAIDAIINPDGTVLLRAERSGTGNGRVYHVHFTASDPEGSVSGVVTVSVPKSKKSVAVDDGELYDSTN